MKQVNVGILGATGAVGQEMIKILEERNFPVASLRPIASARSAGSKISFRGQECTIVEASDDAFEGLDIVQMCIRDRSSARAHGCSMLSTGRIPKSNAVARHCAEKWGFHPVREDAESVTFKKNFEYDEESCWNRLQEVIEK